MVLNPSSKRGGGGADSGDGGGGVPVHRGGNEPCVTKRDGGWWMVSTVQGWTTARAGIERSVGGTPWRRESITSEQACAAYRLNVTAPCLSARLATTLKLTGGHDVARGPDQIVASLDALGG